MCLRTALTSLGLSLMAMECSPPAAMEMTKGRRPLWSLGNWTSCGAPKDAPEHHIQHQHMLVPVAPAITNVWYQWFLEYWCGLSMS